MWSKKGINFKYVEPNKSENHAGLYSTKLLSSDIDKTNGSLNNDINNALKNGCIYLPNYFCKTNDLTLYENIKNEIMAQDSEMKNLVKWSKHFKYENPEFSPTFNNIVQQMAKHFNVEVLQTRLNYYKDGNDFKPLHHDRHAYGIGKDKIKEDFTMGASFGASRQLDIVHEESKNKFSFPQHNGDIFAFDANVNKKFLHGIPKDFLIKEPRFSVIAWGKKLKSEYIE